MLVSLAEFVTNEKIIKSTSRIYVYSIHILRTIRFTMGILPMLKIKIMAHINTYKLKVGFRLYSKHYNLLTVEQKAHVNKIVNEQY